MKSMTCQELVDRLPDWTSGRLDDAESALVAAHVAECDDCSAQASVLGALFAARPEAPAGLAERIAHAARAQAHAVPGAGTKRALAPAGVGVICSRGVGARSGHDPPA